MDGDSKDSALAEESQQIAVYYQNARHHRTINADGIWIGVSPGAKVQFAIYNELRPMPEFVLHEVSKEGGLGEKVEEVVKSGIIREAQVSIVMDTTLVAKFIDLLQQMLSQIENLRAEAQEQAAPKKQPARQ